MLSMLIMLGITLLSGAGWVCVNRYQSHLDRQLNPWIATILNGESAGRRRAR
jgi:hypothetical protein